MLSVKVDRKSDKVAEVNLMNESSAVYSLVPGKILDELDIEPYKEMTFSLADGSVLRRRVCSAYFEFEVDAGPAPVVYRKEGVERLLGATTLKCLGLILNLFTRILNPLRMLMANLKTLKILFIILFLTTSIAGFAQPSDEVKLTSTVKEFHRALVNKNTISLNQQTDKALSYGHSNGWVETKADLIRDLETGYISYQQFTEDSINILMNGTMANVRFLADITATQKGVINSFHLRVLEVWVKKSNRWVLFARQAVKAQ